MPLQYEVVDGAEHDALPRRKRTAGDPDWDRVMGELAEGHTVRIRCADEQERRSLARSAGRRAAHRLFRVDIRHGDGFLSIRKVADIPQDEPDQDSEPTKSGLWGEQEVVETDAAGSTP